MALSSTQDFWFGPRLGGAETEFHLWAPVERAIAVEVEGREPTALPSAALGRRAASVPGGAGTRYAFQLDSGPRIPDPASRAQDGDIGDASLIVDPGSYRWQCESWRGRPWEATVLYELHVGLLGGFAGAAAHLGRVAALGFTAIELMPVADFPGARNWGYDGVLPFAPDRAYGTPDDLKALIDRAHTVGLMVFLDVVYNHFGPDGNWLPEYAPQFFRSDMKTPWGGAINFRQPMVRRFFIENAIYWIHEFRLDGLRFDAVHAIRDRDFLIELASQLRASVPDGRYVHLVLENDDNDAQLLTCGFDAQWNDDLHHALHVLLTGETSGYYEDYARAPAEALARALAEGFVYQGEPSRHRGGAPRGTPSALLAPTSFVAFLQNHDQIGNRAFGERLTTLANPGALRAAVALQLLAPQIPLVFMGEEAGATEPFLYFTDYRNPGLAESVREGRRGDFARFREFSDPKRRERIPDPNAPATFERSRPSFDGSRAQEWNDLYSALLGIRHRQIIPRLKGTQAVGAAALSEAAVFAHWRLGDGATLSIAMNLGEAPAHGRFPDNEPIWGESCNILPANSTVAWIDS
ncbi:MAG TPA: malto-oligosyltrehalose trehalohydrolase [Rhizomicrobium sp.]|jgi:maltooligosyltrehalose trehalohydrolase|nr:malto-oligosyltrehalose trehalohydrolase [Rhizomicrobium sp.]